MSKQQALIDVKAQFDKMAANYQKFDPDSAEFKALKQQVDAAVDLEETQAPAPAVTGSAFETQVLESLEALELHMSVLAGHPAQG